MGKRIDIWQLKNNDEADKRAFMSYEFVTKVFGGVDPRYYEHIYTCNRDGIAAHPDCIFEEFNCNHPSDYTGHSLSVSDIIQITEEDGTIRTLYVNDFGFEALTEEIASQLGKE